MQPTRLDVGKIRREQIIEAAVAVIAEQGLQNLSLSAIESRAGMSRGQLTYYFPAKEDILLAVYDRLLQMMHERARAGHGLPCHDAGTGWERLRHFLEFLIGRPPNVPEFHALQYTFLSQIGHRDDFRARLANLYEDWRGHMAADMTPELAARPGPATSPRTFASFVQALLHGLAMQRAADPDAYDRDEMLALCLEMLDRFLHPAGGVAPPAAPSNGAGPSAARSLRRKKRADTVGPRGDS
jgi:AcrR family transcriptional regulator